MIENYLLEELVTFAQYKTLAATAQHLNITQPTVTRGMQKLEEDFQVKLFDRQPNRITLTETGKLAAKEAQKALDQNIQMIQTTRQFDYSQQIVQIASVAPGPMVVLHSLNLNKNIHLNDKLIKLNSITDNLRNHDFSLLITNQEIKTDDIESQFIGKERLSINLDKFTYLANQPSVTFQELKGNSFVVLTDIGIWKQIIQKNIPDAKFLYQSQVDAFTEITKYSSFPYFSTNISKLESDHGNSSTDDRVNIPISDDSAEMSFYASYLMKQKDNVEHVIKKLKAVWI